MRVPLHLTRRKQRCNRGSCVVVTGVPLPPSPRSVWESVLRHVPDAPCTLSGFLETASMPPEFPKLRRADATPPDVLVAMGSRWPHSLPVSLAPWAARALHRQLWAGPSLSLCNVSDLESLVRSIRRRLLERLAEPQPGEGSG